MNSDRLQTPPPITGQPSFVCVTFSRTFKWFVGIGSFVIVVAAFALWPFWFKYDSICSQCGAIKHATEWQLPRSQHFFLKWSTVDKTVLSSYLASSGVVSAHQHQWLFGHGGGNGVKCALGAGDGIRATVTSSNVVRLLSFSRQFGEPKESNEFLRFAFDGDMSRIIRFLAADMPTKGFTSAEAYRIWITDQRWQIDDGLEMAKQTR